jgi:P4 family phage/plasmid primase-like protien
MIQIIALRNGSVFPGGKKILVQSLAEIFKATDKIVEAIPEADRFNVYYSLAHHVGAETSNTPIRTGKSFLMQDAIAWDLDGIDNEKHEQYISIVCGILGIDPANMTIIASGNGLHFIVFLKTAIKDAAFFTANKPHYNEICMKISFALADAGLSGKADPVVFEPARILRLPGTVNKKPEREDRDCIPINVAVVRHQLTLSDLSGLGDISQLNIPLSDVKKHYPNPDLQEMVSERGCDFLKWCFAKTEEVHEPHAFDAFSILAQAPDTVTIPVGGNQLTSKAAAEYLFNNATSSKSLARGQFENKWQQAIRYGVRKCSTINEHWVEGSGCHLCPHYGKIVTPLALKSAGHIATAAQGYWVMSARGNYQYPHYGDLQRIFTRDYSYVVSAESKKVWSFDQTHYIQMPDLQVKNWLENRVSPTDPIREVHRNEFVSKVAANNTLSEVSERNLFHGDIQGKVNLKNGVLDIATGTLTEHSPRYGFKYCLPYSYDPDAYSEFFMDWLEQITCQRPDLMDALLDFMGYCFLPDYSDHLFVYLVGSGANGKSTFLKVLQAMVGETNAANVSIEQLTRNRFAPAALEGKLVNIGEEASGDGTYLDSFQLNVIKTLSSGGALHVERKGENGYTLYNTAKLIFAANKPPMFKENGEAVKRRLLVIPFTYRIRNLDPTVEDRLLSEAPAIFSMLVKRIQENLQSNNGRYRVSRGGRDAYEAQRALLLQGNTAIEWAHENINSSVLLDDDLNTIEVSEAYGHYTAWCEESGIKMVQNKKNFSMALRDNFLVESSKSPLVRTGNKVVRVFRRAKWNEGIAKT